MTKKIALSGGMFALVDDEWFEELNQYRWTAQRAEHTYYAARNENHPILGYLKRRKVLMHRVIKGVDGSKHPFVDHADHNGLNNCEENLELKTNRANLQNRRDKPNCSSRYIGVTWHKQNKTWLARIRDGYDIKNLGSHSVEEDAARAYDAALVERGLPKVNFK